MKNLLLAATAAALLASCSTDFETIAPYKETMVVYGLMNPNDSMHYFRISKAYLGEGNALIMGKQPDSIYYAKDALDVTLECYRNGIRINTYPLQYTDTVKKNGDGSFFSGYQPVYVFKVPAGDSIVTVKSLYRLVINNKLTGLQSTASTEIVRNFTVDIYPVKNRIDFTTPPDANFSFTLPENTGVCNVLMRIRYTETSRTDSTDVVSKSFDWNLGDQSSSGNSSVKNIFYVSKSSFFPLFQENVKKNPSKKYTFNGIDAYVSAGTIDLYTYMQVTQPATGVVQYNPLFTNVQNGVGIFASRNIRPFFIAFDSKTVTALDSLYNR